jgi:hypothetical protein
MPMRGGAEVMNAVALTIAICRYSAAATASGVMT